MELSNLTDAEFKTLVIKMLSKLRGSIDEFSENFNKEIKNIKIEMEITKWSQLEMKNTWSVMSILEGIERVDEEEYQTSNIEDREAKDTQSEW